MVVGVMAIYQQLYCIRYRLTMKPALCIRSTRGILGQRASYRASFGSLRSFTRRGNRFQRILCPMEKSLLLALMVVIPLSAQQNTPSATTWTGVVQATAGQPVAGAKVTVFTPTTEDKRRTAITSTDETFSVA